MGVSSWSRERFSTVAEDLMVVIPSALAQAHAFAVAAQDSSGTRKKDPYGHTLKNTQHECLIAAAADLPGIRRLRLAKSSFELLQVEATGVVLYPWRYATSSAQSRQTSRMRASSFRQDLLTTETTSHGQLNIEDHLHLSAEQIDAQLGEDAALLEELRFFRRVVTIGYASTTTALLAHGWGDADLVDTHGTVVWRYWEDLPMDGRSEGDTTGTGTDGGGARPPLRSVGEGSASAPAVRSPRFDDEPLEDDDFGITPRGPLEGEPSHERQPPRDDTGTSDPSGDE